MASLANEQLDDELQFGQIQDFSGGEDSYQRSTLIADNQCQHLLNVLVRDNYEARTRPGADAVPSANTKPIIGATSVQKIRYFDTPTYEQLLAFVDVGTTPKFLKFEGNAWTDLTASWVPASSDARVDMAQGVDKLLITDGAGQLQIYNGAAFTGAGVTPTDAPVGVTILTWHTFRMFASGLSTAPDTIFVSNILDFTAGNWDLVTRSFRIGAGDGDPIVAMASMQGYQLAVLKQNSVWIVNTDPTQDGATTYNFAAVSLISDGLGIVGRDAWCSYENDVLFMAEDGVRSVQRMQAAAGQWQLSAPLSQPIQPYISRINRSAWNKICATKYQELAFFFVPLDNSATNNYVLVWNGRLQRWLGVWKSPQSGDQNYSATQQTWSANTVEITRFLGVPQMMFGDVTGLVNKWKDLSASKDDATYVDNGVGYPTQVWPKSWQFGDTIAPKTAYNVILRFSAGNATILTTWIADDVEETNFNSQFQPTGDILGIDVLPFLLASTGNSVVRRGIRGLPAFYEAYLKIESVTGWWFLKIVTAGAFQNPIKEI